MLFNIRGIEVDVVLPQSLEETNFRIDELTIVQNQLAAEIQRLPENSRLRRSKGLAIQETIIEIQILRRWRRNANMHLEKMLANSGMVNSHELRTEPGLIKHLYLELRQVLKEKMAEIEQGSKRAIVLSAAQHWLRQHYSTTLPTIELVQDLIDEEKERQQQRQLREAQQAEEQTQEALKLLSQLAKEKASIVQSTEL